MCLLAYKEVIIFHLLHYPPPPPLLWWQSYSHWCLLACWTHHVYLIMKVTSLFTYFSALTIYLLYTLLLSSIYDTIDTTYVTYCRLWIWWITQPKKKQNHKVCIAIAATKKRRRQHSIAFRGYRTVKHLLFAMWKNLQKMWYPNSSRHPNLVPSHANVSILFC